MASTKDIQKLIMRTLGKLSVQLYRRTGGRIAGKMRGMPVLLLTVAGRKTGVEHTTPVVYFVDDGRYIVTGSAGGLPNEPQWFRNLRRSERAEIQVGPQRMAVAVKVAEQPDREVLWQTLIERAPFFADYQTKVERQIPMAALTPTT